MPKESEDSHPVGEMVRQAPSYVTTDFPWEMFHHDPSHSGYTQARAPSTNSLLWRTLTGGAVYSSPSIVDGIVYIGSSDANLYAFDESSGQVLWVWRTGAAVVASPAVQGGTVYVPSLDQTLYSLEAKTGKLRWSSVQIAPVSSSPTFSGGLLFLGTEFSSTVGTAQVLGLNATTGAAIWSFNWPASISSPSVYLGNVFVGTGNGWVLALDQVSGQLLWQYQTGNRPVSSPSISAGTLYVTTERNRAFALDAASGTLKWTQAFGGLSNPTPTSPGLSKGRLVIGTGSGQIIALNATTGSMFWTYTTSGPVSSSPALTDDTVFAGSRDNNLYSLTLASAILNWAYATGGAIVASPALADGIVFFASGDGGVYAVGLPVPVLTVTVSALPSRVRSGMVSQATITVTASSLLQDPVSLVISPNIGSLTAPTYKGGGVYETEYSAPFVGATTIERITATASKPGFMSGSGWVLITVEPPALMTASATLDRVSISPGTRALLTIRLQNGSLPVVGANVIPLSTMGNFSGVTDQGNGNYTVEYLPPERDFNEPTPMTILVGATKPGFQSATLTKQLVVYGSLPRPPFALPELPIIPIAITGATISTSALGAYWFKHRKKDEKPRPIERSLEFEGVLLRAVGSASELVGEKVWKDIMERIEHRYGGIQDGISQELDIFDQGLTETLGFGAYLVRKLIVRRLYEELRLETLPDLQQDFITTIRNAEKVFLRQQKRERNYHR